MTTTRLCFISFFLAICVSSCGPSEEPREPAAPRDEPRVDLLVKGDYVVAMDAGGTVVENGAVAIDDGVIVAIGPAADIEAEYPAAEVLAGERRIVMPGLVNGHSHAAMTLLRGVADDLALMLSLIHI